MRPVLPPSDSRRITRVTGRARNLERRFPRPRTLVVVFDGLGAELVTGDDWNPVTIHFDGIITAWRLASKEIGDLVVDIWKTDFDGYPATVADTITGGAQPTLLSEQIAEDTSLAGWTTDVAEGDVFMFNVDSVSGITKATLTLKIVA